MESAPRGCDVVISLEEFGQFEDDELLVAPRYGDDAGGEAGQADDVGLGGFADSKGVVRVWFEDRRLVKVRMSSIWSRKIPRGAGLEDCFRQAFMIARAQVGLLVPRPEGEQGPLGDLGDPIGAVPGHVEPEVEALPDEVRRVFGGLPRLNGRSLAAFHEMRTQVEARYWEALQQAEAAEDPVPAGEGVSATCAGVRVYLTCAGFPERVEFAQDWLEAQHSGAICSCVVDAAARALAKYEALPPAPVEEPPALEELRRERDLLRAAYLALLMPKGEL